MPFNPVRNYLAERLARLKEEWKIFESSHRDPDLTLEKIQDPDVRRHYYHVKTNQEIELKTKMFNQEYSTLVETYRHQNDERHQPYELHQPIPADAAPIPQSRQPAPGIKFVPLMYHYGRVILPNPDTSIERDSLSTTGDIDSGDPMDPTIYNLLVNRYPEYLSIVDKYCRPAGTTDATFRDFNKEQIPVDPIDPKRKETILTLVKHFLDVTPYQPVHFVDTQYCKTPLTTGTGYHNRYSFKQKAHAKYSHPPEYANRPTSKGYFYNATYENARTLVHKIKDTGFPFNLSSNATEHEIIDRLNNFFNDYPTLLFTRNHISQRDGVLKVRPVYAVDDLFLLIELMLTFPLTIQARKPSCCIMYGLETVRGSNHYIDFIAQKYTTYFSIDWSNYDQRLPRVITDIYYTDFLRSLIVINQGYQATYEYPEYPDLDEHKLYKRMDNLLHFLHLWYNNMTFLSMDGYAYRRTYCGVPSGLYNTQYLDSFGNLFIMVDAMLEFGFPPSKIKEFLFLILGDDNTAMTMMDIQHVDPFIKYLEKYALKRYNMVLSLSKSLLTTLRSKIETLGYQCNYGSPKRDVYKLAAQLCYPELGIKPHTMAARAIGIAYASAGQDATFHSLCQDIYNIYRSAHRPDPRTTLYLHRNVFHNLEEGLPDLESSEAPLFPSLYEIRQHYSHYQGPLTYSPKWNYAHFIHDPDFVEPLPKTMAQYEKENHISSRTAPTFPTVVPSTIMFP
uniref:RNA-dependent RNA polymerase n=1 Tax=Quinoa-associated betapartitivirus 1 TaxID=2824806 RepID=A0A8D9PCR5_9VIRU|nr:TPA_asm: RNA-dependent RNA polymerase [Quinoa-associated betapartitivirus 1]